MFPAHGKDFYKAGHKPQYPLGTEIVYSNLTARSNKHFNWTQAGTGYVVLWNLQAFIQEHMIGWWGKFFAMDKDIAVKTYKRRITNSVGEMDVSHIGDLHDLGHLPVHIKALDEGTLVPIGIPMFTIVNTNKNFGWVTNMLETLISCEMWKPITVATIAYEYAKLCKKFASGTCDNEEHIPFQCHDFSMRGLSGVHDASVVGSAHLTSFAGTDTPLAIDRLEDYYGADSDTQLVGASVPATEHSVMCMGGKDGEQATVERLLTELYPTGIFSAVLDTWDFFKVLTEMLPKLKDTIMDRDGKFVVRPDSGDPADIICGYSLGKAENGFEEEQHQLNEFSQMGHNVVKRGDKYFKASVYQSGVWLKLDVGDEVPEAEVKGAIELLWETFGGTVNDKGFKVLDEHIGLIYGDSITLERADDILNRLKDKGFASSNVVFGVGSFTYQYITRDTFGMAIKATYGEVNGVGQNIQKDPATDDGTKKSLCGRVMVYKDKDTGNITVKDRCDDREETLGMLKTVFLNGKLTKFTTLEEVRERIASQ
jgi:nicotinamide phosphoribosyltransferase